MPRFRNFLSIFFLLEALLDRPTGIPHVHKPFQRAAGAGVGYEELHLIGLLEFTNLSVGRGTDRPFEHLGAPWIDGPTLADALNKQALPGVRFSAATFTPEASKYTDELCYGVEIHLIDRYMFAPVRTGLAIARTLKQRYGDQWEHEKVLRLLANDAAMAAWQEADSLDKMVQTWTDDLKKFRQVREKYLLYD